MIHLLTTGALMFIASTLSAQCCPYMLGIETIPANPQSGENISIVTSVATPNNGFLIQSGFVISNDTIQIDACYHSGMLTVVTVVNDTIDIGSLDAGMYEVVFHASMSDNPNTCIPVDQNQLDTAIVIGTTHLHDPEQAQLIAYPNPAKDFITLKQAIEHVLVVDVKGRQIPVEWRIVGNETVLDTRKLAPGCYLMTAMYNGKSSSVLVLKE